MQLALTQPARVKIFYPISYVHITAMQVNMCTGRSDLPTAHS